MLKRFIATALFTLLIFTVAFSFFQADYKIYQCNNNDDIQLVLNTDSYYGASSCYIADDGLIQVVGGNPIIDFYDVKQSAKCAVLKLKEPATMNFSVQMHYGNRDYFEEGNTCFGLCIKGTTEMCFVLPGDSKYDCIRICPGVPFKFDSIELHSEAPDVVKYNQFTPTVAYLVPILAALVFGLLFFICDKKWNFVAKFTAYIASKKLIILCAIVCFVADIVIGIIIKLIFSLSFAITAFIIGGLITVSFLVLCKNIISKKPQNVLLGLILIIGSVMILSSPFGHTCWDMDSHYPWVISNSSLGHTFLDKADMYIHSNNPAVHPALTEEENAQNIEIMNNLDDVCTNVIPINFSLPHLLPGVFISVAKMIGSSFYVRFLLGKFANLLIYALVMYFAVKKLKSGKMIVSVFALLPTSLFLASNYTYDYWVTAFATLGICTFISEIQQPEKPMSTADIILIALPLGIASLPKLIYMPLMIIPFFMKKNKEVFKNKKKYYALCSLAIIVFLALFALKSITTISGAGDTRGGAVNPTQQLHNILNNPMEYAEILIDFLKVYLSPKASYAYITSFAYLDGIKSLSYFFLAFMIFAAFTDKNRYDSNISGGYGIFLKIASLTIFLGMVAAIATAFYIDFTPVGDTTIKGCQLRYMTPLILLPLMTIGNGKHCSKLGKINGAVYNYIIFVPTAILIFIEIAKTMLYI